MKRTLTIVGVLVAAATISYGCLTLLTVMSRDRAEAPVSFAGVKAIQLDLGAGSVTLIGGDSPDATGTRTIVRSVARPRVSERVGSDGTLHISTHCPWFASFNCSASYQLTVPPGVVVSGSSSGGSLTFRQIDGDIHVSSSGGGVRGTDLTGDIDFNSSGGGITVTRSTGSLKLDSSGGGITVERSSGKVRASSSGGGIQLRASTSADVDLSSSGGGIRATFSQAPRKVRISSSGGGVRLTVPRNETLYAVDVSSSGGSTSVKVRTDPASANTVWLRSSGGSVAIDYPESSDS